MEQEVPGVRPGGELCHHQGEGCRSDPPARGREHGLGCGGLQRTLTCKELDPHGPRSSGVFSMKKN